MARRKLPFGVPAALSIVALAANVAQGEAGKIKPDTSAPTKPEVCAVFETPVPPPLVEIEEQGPRPRACVEGVLDVPMPVRQQADTHAEQGLPDYAAQGPQDFVPGEPIDIEQFPTPEAKNPYGLPEVIENVNIPWPGAKIWYDVSTSTRGDLPKEVRDALQVLLERFNQETGKDFNIITILGPGISTEFPVSGVAYMKDNGVEFRRDVRWYKKPMLTLDKFSYEKYRGYWLRKYANGEQWWYSVEFMKYNPDTGEGAIALYEIVGDELHFVGFMSTDELGGLEAQSHSE